MLPQYFSALNGDIPTKRVTMVATPTSVVVVGKFAASTARTSVANAQILVNKPSKAPTVNAYNTQNMYNLPHYVLVIKCHIKADEATHMCKPMFSVA